ncbi:DUF1616 domain-containing protein [Natronococcus sp. JC468]|uniref:DUF1616 domain-containing protein n=1 Tax=Natronococcus sp. JC468 TaxID=1961921 RepID=UPI00143B9CEC|nr:DUF1616 domain-containing protein [Natronococcus sp. JC468]NKE37278.1 DUF1616 domain-containing protein [Natronococcus sp. JC468]
MDDRRSLRLLLPRPVRRLPADLAAMLVVTVLVNVAVFAPLVRDTPLRVPLGLVFALFVPGYVFVAALFPEAGESPTDRDAEDGDAGRFSGESIRAGIDGIERVALAFGLSIAVVPLIGLVLNFTPWGIRLAPIMVALSGFTVAATAVAARRRWELPAEERFAVPYGEWYAAGRSELLEPDTRLDGALNVMLILSIVLAVGVVGFAVVSPPAGEQFSAVYLLTEDDDGELVADDYPTELAQGESGEVVLGVDNHEHETTDYTLVAVEQQTETVVNESAVTESDGENRTAVNETVVTEQRELERFETTLAHNESWHRTHEFEPTMTGENVRIVWLLFPGGEVPEEPTTDDTEYHVHLWVDVEDS